MISGYDFRYDFLLWLPVKCHMNLGFDFRLRLFGYNFWLCLHRKFLISILVCLPAITFSHDFQFEFWYDLRLWLTVKFPISILALTSSKTTGYGRGPAVLGMEEKVPFTSKCWKLVFRAFPFMGMFDWGGGLIPAAQWTGSNAPTETFLHLNYITVQ